MSDPVPAPEAPTVEATPESVAPESVAPEPAEPTPMQELGQTAEESFADRINSRLDADFSEPETENEPEPTTERTDESEAETKTTPESSVDDPLDALDTNVEDWTPKAASAFERIKGELKAERSTLEKLRDEHKQLQSQLEEAKAIASSEELEQLRTRLTEYEQRNMINDLESTAVFQEQVKAPLEKLLLETADIAQRYDVDEDALTDVLGISDKEEQDERISELLVDASTRDKARFYRILDDIEPLLDKRDQLHQNAEAALKEAQELERKKAEAELASKAQTRRNIARNVVDRISEKVPFLKGLEGVDLDQLQSQVAEVDPTTLHDVDHVYNASAGKLLPRVVRAYAEAQKELSLLTSKLAEFEDAEPSAGGGGSSQKAGPVDSGKSAVDALNERLSRIIPS